jgi:hypothetical protein
MSDKISIMFGDKVVDLDKKDLQSEEDVRVAIMKVINNTANTTEVLQAADAMAPLFEVAKEERERRFKEGQIAVEKFGKMYNHYVNFRKKHNITAATKFDDLPKNVDEERCLNENLLAMQWDLVKRLGWENEVKHLFPQLKPFLKCLDQIFKVVFKEPKRRKKNESKPS